MTPFLEKYNPYTGTHCWYCDRQFGVGKRLIKQPPIFLFLTKDHIIPISWGGKRKHNLIACCEDCNRLKGSMNAIQFAMYIEELFNLKNKGNCTMYKYLKLMKDRAWKLYNKTSGLHQLSSVNGRSKNKDFNLKPIGSLKTGIGYLSKKGDLVYYDKTKDLYLVKVSFNEQIIPYHSNSIELLIDFYS